MESKSRRMVLGGGLLLPLGVEWWRVSRRARGWTQVEKAGSAFTEYSRSLERRPLLTEMMTSAELFTAAGVVRKEPLDKTARMGLAGGLVQAPLYHTWYGVSTGLPLPVKVLIDQSALLFAWLYLYTFACDKEPPTTDELKQKTLESWRIWLPASVITYTLDPKFRIPWVDAVELLWALRI